MLKALLPVLIALFATRVEASQITGPAIAVDSTVIEISGQRIILFGVDSVMRKQPCGLDGKPWQCWAAAVHELQTLLDQGPASCETVGDPDPFGRVLARCTINGKSLNEQFIRSGFAVARPSESKDYVAAEADAKEKKLGLWQGQFMRPNEFRRAAGIFVEHP
jgi:endonuclease YncB( thermonuclease family)